MKPKDKGYLMVRIDRKFLARVRKIAARDGRTLSGYVRHLLAREANTVELPEWAEKTMRGDHAFRR